MNYYALELVQNNVHRLYNEAVRKTWSPPVKINALVLYDNPEVTSTGFGLDSKYSADVYFHTQELVERNVSPREGDFVEYGQVVYEITKVTQPQVVFGQINNKILTKCTCVPSRENQFQVGNDSSRDVDHTHPIENSKAVKQ